MPSPKNLVVAVNPTAAFGDGEGTGEEVVAALREAGHEVTALREADYASLHAAAKAAIAGGPDALIVVGGDGMVSLGANLLAESGMPLGIVPSGTGNDVARGLGIPLGNTEAAVRMLLASLEHEPRVIDAGRLTLADGSIRWFAGVLSAGFDARVNERANRMSWPKGPRRYTIAMVAELFAFRPIAYTITIDGERREQRAMLAAVANGTSIGGGMLITPDAEFDDGLLDVFTVAPLSKLAFLRLFPLVFSGGHVGEAAVSIVRGSSIRIEAEGVVAYADGERVAALPIDVDVVPAALRVLAPVL